MTAAPKKTSPKDCPQRKAFDAIAAHAATCHPCGLLWAGVGHGRYEFCDEYKRLAGEHESAQCTCRDSE